jgi:RimJ/RimL family protein N-acetyltransferase
VNRQPTLVGQLVEVRPLAEEDFGELYAVAADPPLWEQHPEQDRWREDVFRRYFDDHLRSGGALAIIDRSSGGLIGATRYANFDPERSEVEIGWTFLARAYWGGVYNADLKRIMLGHAFESVDTVVFLVGHDNVRSRRAVEKLGAVENGTRRDMVLYELSRRRALGMVSSCAERLS